MKIQELIKPMRFNEILNYHLITKLTRFRKLVTVDIHYELITIIYYMDVKYLA